MKKCFVLTVIAICAILLNSTAQTTPTDWKLKVVGSWKYLGEEQFGVVTDPDEANASNTLIIRDDMSFEKSDAGKIMIGTYTINDAAKTITFKDTKSGKSKMYYLKKSEPGYLIIEYQTPDLIRTRYKYEAVK
jgi:hypothetical protein